jgi:hypothetical protein
VYGKAGPKPPSDPKMMYVTSDLSIRQVHMRLRGYKGCSIRMLEQRCAKEGWRAERDKFRGEVVEKAKAKLGDSEADTRARLIRSYRDLGSVARGALGKVAESIRTKPNVTRSDANSLRSVAAALHLAHEGERELIDPKDDRVSSIFEHAAVVAEGRVEDIEDWNPEEELGLLLKPRVMLDLSYKATEKTTDVDGNGDGNGNGVGS